MISSVTADDYMLRSDHRARRWDAGTPNIIGLIALGASVSKAQKRAYDMVKKIQWDNVYYRMDIGYRAVAREKG